jgi:hypothetical protein
MSRPILFLLALESRINLYLFILPASLVLSAVTAASYVRLEFTAFNRRHGPGFVRRIQEQGNNISFPGGQHQLIGVRYYLVLRQPLV